MRGLAQFWTWCWCWAISRFLLGEHEYLIFKRSDHIKGLVHVMCADDLTGVEVTEAVPKGEKRDGWAGVRHALGSEWEVRKRRIE